ncbi:MAG: hypothetical protein WCV92_03410 [Candidatus Buchananbacteria bacterium]
MSGTFESGFKRNPAPEDEPVKSEAGSEEINPPPEAEEKKLENDIDDGDCRIFNPKAANMAFAKLVEKQKELIDPNFFTDVKNWRELYDMINAFGTIEMGGVAHTSKSVTMMIDRVRANRLDPVNITRTGGLRKKVIELINNDREAIDDNKE